MRKWLGTTLSTAIVAGLLLIGTPPLAALAAEPGLPGYNDTIVLNLQFEDWAEPKTALVTVRVGVVTDQTQSGLIQARMKGIAEDASDHMDWRIAQIPPAAGARGAALWQAMLETRMTPDDLGRLERAVAAYTGNGNDASFSIERVDFAPTLAEIQAVRASLRAQAYHQAAREIRQLQLAFPDKIYRIASITFGQQFDYSSVPLSQILGDATAYPHGSAATRRPGEATHVTLTAQITLTADPRMAGASVIQQTERTSSAVQSILQPR